MWPRFYCQNGLHLREEQKLDGENGFKDEWLGKKKEPNSGLSYIPKTCKVSCGNETLQTLHTVWLQPKAIWANTEKQNNRFTKTKYKNNLEPKKKKKKNWMAFHGKQILYNMMV